VLPIEFNYNIEEPHDVQFMPSQLVLFVQLLLKVPPLPPPQLDELLQVLLVEFIDGGLIEFS